MSLITKYLPSMPPLPDDFRSALDRARPAIEQAIDSELDAFAKGLGAAIDAQVAATVTELVAETSASRSRLDAAIAKFTAIPPAGVGAAVDELKQAMTDYQAKWNGLGARVGVTITTAVRGVARSAGIGL